MPASIFGDRFLGRREPAWHGLGTVFPQDQKVDPMTATLMVGADFHIQKLPLILTLPDGTRVDSDRTAIVRYPTPDDGSYRVLGYAGKDYEVVGNMELAFMLGRLAEEWPLETAGVLGYGETYFMTLDAGSADVGGEEVRQYFILSNNHTGTRGLKIMLAPVRVVCQNTLMAATSEASVISTLAHTVNVRAEANARIDLIASMRKRQQALLESFQRMARFKVVEDQVREILAASYPYPQKPQRKILGDTIIKEDIEQLAMDDKRLALAVLQGAQTVGQAWEAECKRMDLHRQGAYDQYQLVNSEASQIAGTAWAAWQGVTATECWRNGDPKNPKGTSEAILFGDRAKVMQRGYSRAIAIVDSDG